MRFNPKAEIDDTRVDDAGSGTGGSMGLPIPTSAGGGKLGLVLLVLGIVLKYLASRRSASVSSR